MLVVILMKHLHIYAYPDDIACKNSGTHKGSSCNEEVIIQNTDIEGMELPVIAIVLIFFLDCIKFHNNK